MKKIQSSHYLYAAAGVAVVGLVALVATNRAPAEPSPYDAFAQCLTEKGVTFYGAWWCPHCKNQKELFGTAIQYVNYVECSPGTTKTMSQECKDAGVEGYPMWKLAGGTKLGGEQSLEDLAKASACALPSSSN